jgi:hypothetical protein
MPLWSEKEIYEAAELLELKVDAVCIEFSIFRFGGSVRYILTDNEEFRRKGIEEQNNSIDSVKSIAQLEIFLELNVEDEDFIHTIFYFVPKESQPDQFEMRFGSTYIAATIEERLHDSDEEDLSHFIVFIIFTGYDFLYCFSRLPHPTERSF